MYRPMKLPGLLGQYHTVFGGPYREAPARMFKVKMAAEIREPFDVSIPTPDFSVPKKFSLDVGLDRTVQAILAGEPVYVGCMGGKGRTGLFLAVLAKTWGINHPVEYVRKHYYSHAVETKPQYKFVMDYEIPYELRSQVLVSKVISRFSFENHLTVL